jgi:hypothetical protein
MTQPIATLIVKVPRGLQVRNAPTAVSKVLRSVRVGESLDCYHIAYVDTVPYGKVSPDKSEWVRIAEADGNVEYVDVVRFDDETDSLIAVLERIAKALEK